MDPIGAVILGAGLASLGWYAKRKVRARDALVADVSQLKEDVAWIMGVLAAAFPTAAAKMDRKRNS